MKINWLSKEPVILLYGIQGGLKNHYIDAFLFPCINIPLFRTILTSGWHHHSNRSIVFLKLIICNQRTALLSWVELAINITNGTWQDSMGNQLTKNIERNNQLYLTTYKSKGHWYLIRLNTMLNEGESLMLNQCIEL